MSAASASGWFCCNGGAKSSALYVDGYELPTSIDLDMLNISGRLLQSGDGGASSETCRAIGLADTCCLTLTFLATPYLMAMFLIIKCRPANAIISIVLLSLTAAFLAYIAWVDYLNCVAALFILCVVQWLSTCTYLIRRRINYGSGINDTAQKCKKCMRLSFPHHSCCSCSCDVRPGWLMTQNEDRENPIARVVEQALIHGRRNGNRGINPGAGIGAAVRRAQAAGVYSPRSSAANLSAMYAPAASSAQAQRCRATATGSSPEARRYTASDIRGAAFSSSPSLKSAAVNRSSLSESLSDLFFDVSATRTHRAPKAPSRTPCCVPSHMCICASRVPLIRDPLRT